MKRIRSLITLLISLWLAGSGAPSASCPPGATGSGEADSTAASAGDELVAEQSDTVTAAQADTTEQEEDEARFIVPEWTLTSKSDMSSVSLGSRAQLKIDPGGGWILNSRVGVTKTKYRTRDMEDINEQLMNSALKMKEGLYTLSLTLGEDYRKSKTVSLSRFGKEIVYENERAGVKFDFTKPLFLAKKSIFSVGANYVRGQQDFKYDRQTSGAASGHLTYAIGDKISLGGGYGTYYSSEGSEIGTINFDRLPSTIDTVKVSAGFLHDESNYVRASFERRRGDIRKVEPPRGNALEIIDNPELANEEHIEEAGEVLSIKSGLNPADFLEIEVSFERSLDEKDAEVDERLSKKSVSDKLSASTRYNFSEKGNVKFTLTKNTTDLDYGPFSVSSYKEEHEGIKFDASQRFENGIAFSLSGNTHLKQRYYKKYEENPRDIDYFYYGGSASMTAEPFENVDANVEVSASRYETRNIDASLSNDNRADYIYRLMPGFTAKPLSWLSLSQDYEVKIEYTEFTFDENRNYIDRTTVVITGARMTVQEDLTFSFEHKYDMRDTGSYLKIRGEERYNRSSEDFKHEIRLDLDYRPVSYLDFFSGAFFRNRKNNILGVKDGERIVRRTTFYDSGTFKAGFSSDKDIMAGGNMKLDLAYVRNFGYKISKAMEEYWEVDMSLRFVF